MKHTDITPLLSRIRDLEKEELKKLVRLHGNKTYNKLRPVIDTACA